MDLFSRKNMILLREMIKTDFKLRYQGSLIGHLWSILKPLLLFTIMYLVFVRFLRFDDGTPHYAIGLLIGMVTSETELFKRDYCYFFSCWCSN